MSGTAGPVMVFDTNCVLCSGGVHFVLRRETPENPITFVNAWGKTGGVWAERFGLAPESFNESFLLVVDGKPLFKSDAAIEIARHLRAPWRWLGLVRFVPRGLRDWGYDLVARNRYRLFGRRAHCFVPPPGAEMRFIED